MDEKIIRPHIRPLCGNVIRVYPLFGDQGMLLRWVWVPPASDVPRVVDCVAGAVGDEAMSLQVWS